MANIVKVGMADLNVCKSSDGVTTLGLGSCVGVCIPYPIAKVGGLVHAMLPDSTQIENNTNRFKFADTGIEDLVKKLVAMGGNKSRFEAKLAGGAKMFAFQNYFLKGLLKLPFFLFKNFQKNSEHLLTFLHKLCIYSIYS